MNLALAIDGRRMISFEYDGLHRVVQPATYGQTSTGKWSLRGCLVEGESRRNTIPCWELYTEAKMLATDLTGEEFEDFALDGYTRGDSGFVNIVAEN